MSAPPPKIPANPYRILPMGDSISVGYTDNPAWTVPFQFGYRSGLYTRLTNSGMSLQYVGNSLEPWNGERLVTQPPLPTCISAAYASRTIARLIAARAPLISRRMLLPGSRGIGPTLSS